MNDLLLEPMRRLVIGKPVWSSFGSSDRHTKQIAQLPNSCQ
jgi:hypothetical protein